MVWNVYRIGKSETMPDKKLEQYNIFSDDGFLKSIKKEMEVEEYQDAIWSALLYRYFWQDFKQDNKQDIKQEISITPIKQKLSATMLAYALKQEEEYKKNNKIGLKYNVVVDDTFHTNTYDQVYMNKEAFNVYINAYKQELLELLDTIDK